MDRICKYIGKKYDPVHLGVLTIVGDKSSVESLNCGLGFL